MSITAILVVTFIIFPLISFSSRRGSIGRGRGRGISSPISSPDNTLEKTDYEKEISFVDYKTWNSTVSSSYLPDYYFGDYSIIPGYSGDFTVRSWSFDVLNASEMFKYYIIPRESLLILNSNFNESYIDTHYGGLYIIDYIYSAPAFEEDRSVFQIYYIFRYPQYLKNLYDDYNSYTIEVNNDSNPFTPTLSNYTAEEFLFKFFVNQTALTTPNNLYLYTLVNLFNDEDVKAGNNELILNMEGISNYTVRIGFDEMGLNSYIIFLDENNVPFYGITTNYNNEHWIVWLLLLLACIGVLAIITYFIRKRIKRDKEFKESLETLQM